MSCHPDKHKPVESEDMRFTTTDASEMYFKNIRQSSYLVEQKPEAGINIYRNKDFRKNEIWLEPILVINWRNDQAFLLMEEKQEESTDEVSFSRTSSKNELLTFDKSHHKNHTEFALLVYNSLLNGDTVLYHSEGEAIPLLQNDIQRTAFRKVVFDWLRIVEIR